SKDQGEIKRVVKAFNQKFTIHEIGQPKRFIGMNLARDRNSKVIYVDQSDYIDSILERFEMKNCRPAHRLERYVSLNSNRINEKPIEQIIGSLQYLACKTRPDIAYITNRLAQEVKQPSEHLFSAAKHVLRYLKH